MHKLLDYICSELEDLERKTEKGDSLTMSEIQYMDTLLHAKKNLLKTEEMMGEDGQYSEARGGYSRSYRDGYSREYGARGRGRNARRDSMGRYADGGYSNENMADQLRDMMDDAPDENTRKEFQRFIDKIERR